jgi:N-acetylglucosamine-6-phosphate deacetylase
LITNGPEIVIQNLKILEQARQEPSIKASVPGYFLEGPYISPEDGFRGAHLKDWVRQPDWDEFKKFVQASNHNIIQVGLSPEFPGSMSFIKNCVANDIMVSLAHHNGSTAQIDQAVELGARISTHLGNGCANYIHRHENPIWPQLANDLLTPTIIADGHHLRREELKVFYEVKAPDNLILVSDATKLSGMPPGEYNWNGKKVLMTDDGMLKYPDQDVLAGASFPVKKGIETMVAYGICDLADAIRLATEIPARIYQFSGKGKLAKDMDADIICFSFNEGRMEILETILMGETVYKK